MPQTWTIERTSENVWTCEIKLRKPYSGWVLLMSDEHFDNAHCDRRLLKKHHQEAVEKNAPIFKFGDTFCAMQGKWDKRADQDELRPEHQGNNYLDKLVDTAAGKSGLYTRFANQIALISQGNHETAILKRHQTDLIERMVDRLRQAGGPTLSAGYWGFVRFHVVLDDRVRQRWHRDLCFHHGYGGGGEVTRGLIDNNRTRGQYLADIYYSGHIHRRNEDENIITQVSAGGTIQRREQLFLRGGSYKADEDGLWHVGRGGAARPRGGWWINFTIRYGENDRNPHLCVSSVRAT